MYIQQIYTGCLAQAAYYLESDGEAAIIDPLRDIQVYVDMAKARNAKITYVFETHFHADFVSGHIDLLKKTGGKIVYGPGSKAGYDIITADDGQEFKLGKCTVQLLHTPGHTAESSCFIVKDEHGVATSVFTGDTLFVGEVGRVDLAANSTLTKEQLGSMLYDSLEKLKKLDDKLVVYPGHGAGSACGKNIGKESTTTIGEQRKNNYALQPMTREHFVALMTDGLETPPQYFFIDAVINRKGYENDVDELLGRNVKALDVVQFKTEMDAGVVILDTRNAESFAKEHIPGAVNAGLRGQFAIWVGSLFGNIPFVLVCDEGKENESVMRLARVGYDSVKGYLKGGVQAWKDADNKTQNVESVEATEFIKHIGETPVLDVRNDGEVAQGMVKDAISIPLGVLPKRLNELNKNEHYYVHCAGGYRSMIALSLLQKNGFTNLTNVNGGTAAMIIAGLKLEVPAEA